MANKRVIVIGGPTAAGKTSAAIALALELGTEIISADSRQCYRELNIGVARPTPEQLQAVPHHFMAEFSIHQKITAADFEQYALQKTAQLFETHNDVVMVGGTGLYIKAFCEGLDTIPTIPQELRDELLKNYQQHGLSWLQQQVATADPHFYSTGEIKNPHRLLRALEVVRSTGQSILTFRRHEKTQRNFIIEKVLINIPKPDLHRNINARVDSMIEHGLEDEVRSLIPYQHLNALQTVGYKEFFNHFNGLTTHQQAIEEIKKNTRNYAKRQLTWNRRYLGM
jgi:tRNA dimethylallyltransferase